MAQTKAAQPQKINWRKTAVLLVAIYVLCRLFYGFFSVADLKKQEELLAEELTAAYAEQAELHERINYMQSEDAIEKTARERLGLIKEDEILIQRVDGE